MPISVIMTPPSPEPPPPSDVGDARLTVYNCMYACVPPCLQVLAPGLCTLFKHRLDCRRVSHVGIQGDVVVTQVSYDAGPVGGRHTAGAVCLCVCVSGGRHFWLRC